MNGGSSSLLSLGLNFSFPFFILLCHLFGGPYPTLCLGFTLGSVLCAQGSPLALGLELTSSRAQELQVMPRIQARSAACKASDICTLILSLRPLPFPVSYLDPSEMNSRPSRQGIKLLSYARGTFQPLGQTSEHTPATSTYTSLSLPKPQTPLPPPDCLACPRG